MSKRRHNIKGRQVNNVVVDNTETKKVKKFLQKEKNLLKTDNNFLVSIITD